MEEKIGIFRGKPTREMDRDELLYFAEWASKRIDSLEKLADKHLDLDLERDVLALSKKNKKELEELEEIREARKNK